MWETSTNHLGRGDGNVWAPLVKLPIAIIHGKGIGHMYGYSKDITYSSTTEHLCRWLNPIPMTRFVQWFTACFWWLLPGVSSTTREVKNGCHIISINCIYIYKYISAIYSWTTIKCIYIYIYVALAYHVQHYLFSTSTYHIWFPDTSCVTNK